RPCAWWNRVGISPSINASKERAVRMIALATILLATRPVFGQDEAEKLYRAMEKKIASAKTVELTFEAALSGARRTTNMKGKIYAAEGAKTNLTMEGSGDADGLKMVMISDGKTNYVKESDKPPQTIPVADAKRIQQMQPLLARLGMTGSLFIIRASPEPPQE